MLDEPRSNRFDECLNRKDQRLSDSHMVELNAYRLSLEVKYKGWFFPNFDPDDGGVDAELLFLFEKPGPMTDRMNGGSGYISMDNDDPSAEATWRFMRQAGIERKRVVSWNVIPGWNGTINLTAQERRDGVEELRRLMDILSGSLKAVVLLGKQAHKAEKILADYPQRVFYSAHPSPKVRAIYPKLWNDIPNVWARAALVK